VTREIQVEPVPGPGYPELIVPSPADSLLLTLRDLPEDAGLREQAARALLAEGRPQEAVAVLKQGFANLTAHEAGSGDGAGGLPCLCRSCLDPGRTTAQAGDMIFVREFTAHAGRVLYFWMPQELLPEQAEVRRAVQVAMAARLKRKHR
jgi:hypothetical protein